MPTPNFAKMTKDELLQFAAKNKIAVKPSLLKAEIIALLHKEMKKAAKPKKPSAKADKPKTWKIPASTGRTATGQKKGPEKPAQKPPAAARAKKVQAADLKKEPARKAAAVPKPASRRISPEKSAKPAPVKKVSSRSLPAKAGEAKKPATRVLHPKFELEDMAQEAKFIVGQPKMRDEAQTEIIPQLPENYGDHKLVFMARDPYWGFLYWELQQEKIDQGLNLLSRSINEIRCILRVHPVLEKDASSFDVDVDFGAGRKYIPLSPPGGSFYCEIGLLDPEGRFAVLAVSNTATLPQDGPSDVTDERWMTSDAEFEKIYALSGGGTPGLSGSEQAQKISREQRRVAFEFSSSGVSSFGSAEIQKPGGRGFRYWLDAELIVYGGADRGSTIRLAGRDLELRPDGTFTARFALPDGTLDLPVTFIAPDKMESYTVTPVVTRKTEHAKGESR